jgi:hypothetical protein
MKPFDQQLFDENDRIAKEAVRDFIKYQWNLEAIEGEKFGVDLVVKDGEKVIGYAEVERRHNWVGKFTFPTVHVPYRKRKFFEQAPETALFAVSQDMSQAMWARGEDILASPIVKVDNRFMADEPFYDVPVDKWKTVELLPF